MRLFLLYLLKCALKADTAYQEKTKEELLAIISQQSQQIDALSNEWTISQN